MTVLHYPTEEAISRVEKLAAYLAEIDEAGPIAVSIIGDLVQNIIMEPDTPAGVAAVAQESVASLEKLRNNEYDFDAFYDEICEHTSRMQEVLEEACRNGLPEPADDEDLPPMSQYDIEDLDMQFDVMEGLYDELKKGDRHLVDVFANLLGKTLAVENLPRNLREKAKSAAGILDRMASGELDIAGGSPELVSVVGELRAEFNSLKKSGEQDSGVELISESETGMLLLEGLENEILALENGDASAVARIADCIGEIKETAASELPPLAHTFLNGVISRLRKGNVSTGSEAVDPLLSMKDVLFEYFDARTKGGSVKIDESNVSAILSRLNKISGRSAGSGDATAKPAPAPALNIEIPEVCIEPGNPEMMEFVSETREYIQGAESAMMVLENDPKDSEQLNEVFRCFHNIKGISGFLELLDAQMLAHEAESMMEMARTGQVDFTGIYVTLAFEALDMFKEIVGRVEAAYSGEAYSVPESFVTVLARLKNPEAAAETAAVAPAPEPSQAQDAATSASPGGNGSVSTSHKILRDTMVKLSTNRLDNLVDMVGELVIANAMVSQEHRKRYKVKKDREMAQKMAHLDKITRELQEMAMSLRMVSLQGTFQKLARIARDTAHKAGVPVEFSYSGDETELDRNVVEEITSPLVHMVRNSIDHGIERPQDRRAAGKPEKGTVHISACHEGGNVVIRISDDGRGLDREAIVEKAIARNLMSPADDLPDKDVFAMIFHPGFSTAKEVTDISGRGVGMDVVKSTIEGMRGRVDIHSAQGEGTTFTIHLPLTLAIIDGMVVDVGGERYIIPTVAIQESIRPNTKQLSTVTGQGEMLNLRNNLMPLFRLHELFEISNAKTTPTDALAIVVGENGKRCALMVDNLLGQQQVVIKSIGKLFDTVDGVSGGAIMGDGNVALILDAAGLARLAHRADIGSR